MIAMKRINELRWNPILHEWIIVSSGRSRRPWRPAGYCPFCPGGEETGEGWDILVLENRFPALRVDAVKQSESKGLYRARRGYGRCLVIVETPRHEGDLCDLDVEHLKKYLDVLVDIYLRIGSDPLIKCVIEFRNRGAAVGVSLTHPHSQVYALPFIPSRIRRELRSAVDYWRRKGKCLFCEIVRLEREDGSRIVFENQHVAAFVPFFAMWPFEVHLYPVRHVRDISETTDEERFSIAEALKTITRAYNRLFNKEMPYMMILHQRPTDGGEYKYYHFHVEFYPIMRDNGKIKYAAGIEWGAGTFTYDGLPENNAARLREA